jgi:hypothetical protein
MRQTMQAVFFAVIGLTVGHWSIRATAQGQPTQTRTPDAAAQLVDEVHGLRVATEHLASTGLKIQLTLGRVQLQEQRIAALQRRLDSLQESIRADKIGAHPELKTEAARIEQEMATEAASWSAFNNQLVALEKTIDAQR